MKMKKSLYLAAIAALSLTACSDNNNDIFDQNAAERLENYKQEYTDVLTADGGLWVMEYFSNEEEPGYLFVMRFNKNGSVDIAANHKWIDNTYKEETSLWRMIADNGPVLSFDSFNSLFHIFSDPANITGTDAPKGENDDDINETGYGHNGDYEFQVMEVSEDGKVMRLLGKKRLFDIYLRRLDASTDVKAYMDAYKEVETNLFSKEVPNLLLKDETGERYVVRGASTGVMSIYPEAGDAVDQVRTSSFIITTTGIRFLNPLVIENAAGEERTLEEFKFTGNYSLTLADNESIVLNAGSFEDIINLNHCNWKVDLKNLEGSIKESFNAFVDELKTLYNYKSAAVNEMTIDYNAAEKTYILRLYLRIGAKSYETDKFYLTFSNADAGVKIAIGSPVDEGSSLALNAYSKLQAIFSQLTAAPLPYTSPSDCGPKTITLDFGDGKMPIIATK